MKKILSFLVLALLVIVGAQVSSAKIYNPSSSSLTPWTSNINGAGYSLTAISFLTASSTTATSTFAGIGVFGGSEADQTIAGTLIRSILTTHAEGTTEGNIAMHHHTDTATRGSTFYGTRSRGTEASETTVSADDNLLDIVASGFDGTDYANAARLDMEVDGTPGSNDMPGRFVFRVSPDGSGTPAEVMRITNAGKVGIATTSPATTLQIGSGSILVSENTLATSTTMTVDWTAGNQQLIRMSTAATAITFSNNLPGQNLKMIVCNPPTGTAGALTFSTPVYWANHTVPTQTTTANTCDAWSFISTAATSTNRIFGAMTPNF